MNYLFKASLKQQLDTALSRAIIESEYYEPSSDEYHAIVENIHTMAEARQNLEGKRLDPNTVANITASLVLVLVTMHYEELNVYRTQALTWIRKLF